MKRFYSQADMRPAESAGWMIELDGRAVRTPAGQHLCVPTRPLAEAICAEWNAQGDMVDVQAMALTRMSNAAIDVVPSHRPVVVDQIVQFGETDMLCYRASEPAALVARQQAEWQPVLDWLHRHYDAPLRVTEGIVHVRQPGQSIAVLRAALDAMTDFELVAVSNVTSALGSLVLALAVRDGAVAREAAWNASILDETFQETRWGEDAEAAGRRAARHADFEAAAIMLNLSGGSDD